MKTLVFIHGWGLGPSLWDEVRRRLPLPSRSLDLGYYGTPDLERPPGTVVLVGHSLGFQLALQGLFDGGEGEEGFDAWVSISGFPRFVGGPDFPEGVAPRVLERMRRRFAQAPEQVLADFLGRCGTRPPPGRVPDVRRLGRGLASLAELDLRDALPRATPRKVLAGTEDPIVPPAMAEALWGDAVSWVPGGGHLLPRTHPDVVARALADFVETLS